MTSYSKFPRQPLSDYAFYDEPLSKEFKVFLNNEEIPVYTCRISKYPFNTVWPGHQRDINQTELVSFVNIVSDEPVTLEVVPLIEYKKALIKPYSKNIQFKENDGKITFTLNENGQFAFESDNYHHLLYIFNSKPIAAPKKEDVTYYFDAGIHFTDKIILKSNESVYIDKDALIYGCFFAENAENIHIFGNGIIDNSTEERVSIRCYEKIPNGNLKFYDCKNIKIEGIGMKNSSIWCLNLFGCFDITVDDIKIFGQWRYNTDGIDIVNCQNVCVKNSFVHSFDDSITIKGIERYCHIDNQNIHIENCVLWCDWGKCCEVGVETACRQYTDISFKNCDIIKAGCIALDISNGYCAEISNVIFQDINVEYNNFDTEYVYQESEEMIYDAQNTVFIPKILVISNQAYHTAETCKLWSMSAPNFNISLDAVESRVVHGIVFKNINIYYDDGLPLENSKPHIEGEICSVDDKIPFYNIDISDIFVNGEKLKKDDLAFKVVNANVSIE